MQLDAPLLVARRLPGVVRRDRAEKLTLQSAQVCKHVHSLSLSCTSALGIAHMLWARVKELQEAAVVQGHIAEKLTLQSAHVCVRVAACCLCCLFPCSIL